MEYFFEPVPDDQAALWIRRKLPLTQAQFKDMVPELQALAFTISGVEAADALQDIRDTVATLPEGALFKDVQKTVAAKMAHYTRPPADLFAETPEELKARQAAALHKARFTIRHHGNQAYATTAYKDLNQHRDIFPYWKYITVGDGRVRDSHRALGGLILPQDHEFWKTHFPPWEFGCRCQVVPVTGDEYEEEQKLDEGRELYERHTLDPTTLQMLTNERKLIRNIGGVPTNIDLRAPIEVIGNDHPYIFRPDEFQLPLESLRDRYDDVTWKQFEKFARGTKLPGGGSVWGWLNKGRAKLPKVRVLTSAFPELAALPDLKQVKQLGGSTGAVLVEDAAGQRFVKKLGSSPGHLREEALADELYRSLGVAVPDSRLYETATGPVKLARFLEGDTLADKLRKATQEDAAVLLAQAQEGFLADALLGNWDAVGLDLDNMLVDKAGLIWRIDNGGALRYRAQGALKSSFPNEVLEIDTLRDPKVNAAAARVFGSLQETDLVDQFEHLQDRLPDLLAAAPADLREVLQARFTWLESRLVRSTPFNKAFVTELKSAQLTGLPFQGDRDLIEDTTVLFWEEKDKTGKLVTKAKLRLTEAGSDAMVKTLGPAIRGPLASSGPRKLSSDTFWSPILEGVMHVNKHAADGIYNPAKLANIKGAAKNLNAFTPATADEAAMKAAYLDYIQEIEDAHAAKTTTKTKLFTQYRATPPKVAPAASATSLQVVPEKITWKAKDRKRGQATETDDMIWEQDGFRISGDDDASMSFVPWKDAGGHATARYAFRGMVEITIPGGASADTLQRATALLTEAGVDAAPASAAYQELVYLRKGLQVQKLTPARVKTWQAIADDTTLDDATKVTKLRTWVEKSLKISLADQYQPGGRTDHRGHGWRLWERWDLPRTEIESQMAGYGLHHSLSGSLPKVLDSILDGGGWFTPTMERLRTGVSISAGKSPESDMGSGGANYLFTRLLPANKLASRPGLVFKVGNLSRMDHFSYGGDYFGDVRPKAENDYNFDPHKKRAKTILEWQANSAHGNNETIFKNGLPLLDEVQTIRTFDAKERDAVLKVFAKHGITALPDGRLIETVIVH